MNLKKGGVLKLEMDKAISARKMHAIVAGGAKHLTGVLATTKT